MPIIKFKSALSATVWLLAFLSFEVHLQAQTAAKGATPEWIWRAKQDGPIAAEEVCYFRRLFTLETKAESATLAASCDNELEVFINGTSAGTSKEWKEPLKKDVAALLQAGDNVIAVRGQNHGGSAAMLLRLEMRLAGGNTTSVVSDTSWKVSRNQAANWETLRFAPEGWASAQGFGKLGVSPWGDVLNPGNATAARSGRPKVVTPVEALKVLPGFKVELIYTAGPEDGSWVSMAIDRWGRLIVSPQEIPKGATNGGLLRFTLDPKGKVERMEKLITPVGGAQGMLSAFDSLYVNGSGPEGTGLYRLRETRVDGHFDDLKFLQKLTGRGEHGSHAVVLGPDQMLYVMNGNFVKQLENISPTSPHRHYADDLLLPRQPDGNGFGNGTLPPGGHLLRTDAEGKQWEIVAAGFRNAYDFAINPDGEMFTYDSDMEWDIGAPWYRPTRLLHVVTGGDYGFREGTGKWPNHYPDSLPTMVDVGLGSPTGMKFGTDSHFPPKYKHALFAFEWAYGRILAAHLTPTGATYSATFENFITGKPLNVTDLEFRRVDVRPNGQWSLDGSMYFITGGRGTQSGLYRVSYLEETTPEPPLTKAEIKLGEQADAARLVRRTLESYAGRTDAKAIEIAWPHLDSSDRWLRYAARIALESQDLTLWKARALKEGKPRAAITAMLALARLGGTNDLAPLLKNLQRISFKSLDEPLKLELLRVYGVAFARLGRPTAAQAAEVVKIFDPQYPSTSTVLNRELCQLLVYLDAPGVVTKTMVLLKFATTQQDQMYYVFTLRNVTNGWTPENREAYFTWFNKARKEYKGGNSFQKFITNIKKDALVTLTETEKTKLAAVLVDDAPAAPKLSNIVRPFVKEWKMDDLIPSLDEAAKGRSYARGRQAFIDLMCIQCHRFGNEGGSIGPDITAAASRFSRHDLLESILEPSKVVSDQYQYSTVVKRNGNEYTGRIAEEDAQKIAIIYNPFDPQRVEILKADIEKRTPSTVSPMPEGLANVLSKEEILDLLAYIESGGKPKSTVFAK